MTSKKGWWTVQLWPLLCHLIIDVCNAEENLPSQKGFISIDCGRKANESDVTWNGMTWLADVGYTTSGEVGTVSTTDYGPMEGSVEYTLRFFPTGKKNCYVVGPVIPGNKYMVRVRSHYYNYDRLSRARPTFDVAIGPTWIDTFFPLSWPYGEYILDAVDTTLDVCFIRVDGGGDPFVSALEVRPMGEAYKQEAAANAIMNNWKRLVCGLDDGDGATVINSIAYPLDPLDRFWGTDRERIKPTDGTPPYGPLLTWPVHPLHNKSVDITLDSVPSAIYAYATTTKNDTVVDLTYNLLFDNVTGLPFMLYLYFAEHDESVQPGERIFNILVNGEVVHRGLDIRQDGGSVGAVNLALKLNYTLLSKTDIKQWEGPAYAITLSPTRKSQKPPIISGVENYILVPKSTPTNALNVNAMQAVRSQLFVSNNQSVISSWGGDPCLPTPWDGVVCSQNSNKETVVTGLELGNLGLNGTVPAAIGFLSSLENLILNDNNFQGPFPGPLPATLKQIRVENNQLNGTLPKWIGTLPNLILLNVSNNPLYGGIDNSLSPLAQKLGIHFGLTLTYLCPSAIPQCDTFQMRSSDQGRDSAPPPSRPPPGGKRSNSRNIVAIVGGVTAGVVLLAAIAAVLVLCVLRSKRQSFFSSVGGDSGGQQSTTMVEKLKKLHEGLLGQSARFGQGGRIFTLKDMEAATSRWSHSNIIGVGGFGIVYKGSLDGRELAVKKRSGSSMQGEKEFYNEVDLLSRVRHKHLVTLVGYCNEGQNQILVYEYMANGTVRDHLYDEKGEPLGMLDWRMRLGIALGAARGIEYLHTGSAPSIIHRDIKTSNILLDENFMAKVADFGLSKLGPEGFNTHVSTAVKGTAGYLDPEYYTVQQLTHKSDVFSFGVVLLELITGREPINHNRPRAQWNIVEWARPELQGGNLNGIVDPTLGVSWSLGPMWKMAEVGILCVEPHAENRPTISEVVRELKEAVDMEFGMQNYIVASHDTKTDSGFSHSMVDPASSELLDPASSERLESEIR